MTGDGHGPDAFPLTGPVNVLRLRAIELYSENKVLREIQRGLASRLDRFVDLFDLAPVGYLILDESTTVLDANAVVVSLLGVKRSRLCGRLLSEFILEAGPFGARTLARHLLEVSQSKEKRACELDVLRNGGPAFRGRLETVPVERRRSEYEYWVTLTDVTDERRVSEARSRLAAIVESSEDAILLRSLDDTILEWNPAAERIYGYGRNEAVGRHIDLILPEHRRQAEAEIVRRIAAKGDFRVFETVRRTKSGREVPVSMTLSPIRNEAGEVVAVSAIGRDITEAKEREAALRDLNETLEGRVVERTKELAEANRELARNAERLRELGRELAGVEERERQRIASDIHDRIGQTLALANMKLGAVRASLPSASAGDIDAIRELLIQTIEDSQELVFDLSPPMLHEAGLRPALEWLGDRLRDQYGLMIDVHGRDAGDTDAEVKSAVFAAIQEILINVGKHAKVDRAVVRLKLEPSCLSVVVEDRGVGFQPSGLKHWRPGTGGFGLFGVRERMAQVGGSLRVRSTPGQGTRVTLRVPVASGGCLDTTSATSTGFSPGEPARRPVAGGRPVISPEGKPRMGVQ